MILVSSCLAGLEVRYDGTHSFDHKVNKLIEKIRNICLSKVLGVFSTPRELVEIIGGSGNDVFDEKLELMMEFLPFNRE